MKNRHAQWIATAGVLVAGLAAVSSAQAQGVTGSAHLDNLSSGAITYYPGWSSQPPTVITSGASGFEVASSGYGSLYYAVPGAQLQTPNPADDQVTLTFTLNAPAGSYYVGVPFIINDNSGAVTYGGYSTYGPGTFSETLPLSAGQLAAVQTGSDKIYGFNLEFDPAGNVPGGAYDITFNSLTLSSSVPEPSTLSMIGLGATGFLALCRRKK